MIERDNLTPEPTDKAEKIKTPFAVVIVDGPIEKPYYSVMWWDTTDQKYIVGYSSYNHVFVFEWLKECFEVDNNAKHPYEIALDDLRPHGRWEECDWVQYDGHSECVHFPRAGLVCTNCRNAFKKELLWKDNYCPNCGAKMDLKE